MNIVRIQCAICSNIQLQHIYDLPNFPINLSCIDVNVPYMPRYNGLSFAQCSVCNTVQLDRLIPLDVLYEKSHNFKSVGKVWDAYFATFVAKLFPLIPNKTILEIGCPSGKLAQQMNHYDKWYIIEPNRNMSIQFNAKIQVIETFFDADFELTHYSEINRPIDIIVHSHLFEHIYEPNAFLQKCYEILSIGGEMIFGVPNMEYLSTADLSLFLGIFFEHTIFLNKDNITYLLNRNGFDIIEIIDYANHSTIYHTRKCEMPIGTIEPKIISNYLDTFFAVIDKYLQFITKCNDAITTTDKDVYIFGASSNTQILLSMGLIANKMTGILDNCIEKHDSYLYGFDLIICNPEIIRSKDCIIILKNGYYVNEIMNQIQNLNPNTEIII